MHSGIQYLSDGNPTTIVLQSFHQGIAVATQKNLLTYHFALKSVDSNRPLTHYFLDAFYRPPEMYFHQIRMNVK